MGGILVDYLRFTLPDEVGLVGSLHLLGAVGWVDQERGALGYASMKRRGHVKILHEGRPGMGVHVEISGKGCREMEAERGFTWGALLQSVVDLGGHFTRIDWALDDHEGRLDLEQIAKAAEEREWVSRWKSARVVRETMTASAELGPVRQLKVTFGARESDAFLRFYDKAAQLGEAGHWVRCELELRNERATLAVVAFLKDGPGQIVGVLRGYLTFVEGGTATRLHRATPSPWWEAFLEYAAKVQLIVCPVERSLDTVARWVQRQAAPSLALLFEGLGVAEFMQIVMDGKARFRPWHRQLLQGVAGSGRAYA